MKHSLRLLALLAAGTVICLLLWYWDQVRNEFFVIIGNRNLGGGWEGLWSGFFGAVQPSLLATGILLWYQHTCHHSPWCLRWGKYAVAGGIGRKCHRHHPDLKDHPREHHGAVLDRLHEQWKAARQ
jgi:hypothetical protein